MPLAHPLAIAVSMPVTVPPSQCRVTVPAVGESTLKVMSALPAANVASSANGATGTSSGTLTSAMSEDVVDADERGPVTATVAGDHGDAP